MEQPTNLMMISGLLTLDRVPEWDWLAGVLEHRLCSYERFKMRVVEHGLAPRWEVDNNFEVDHHLRYEELEDKSHQGFLRRVGELMSEPLSRARPLWEFRVFPGVEGGAAMLVRLHHAIADGIALMRVLLTLTDQEREAPRPRPQPTELKPRDKGGLEKAKRLASHLLHEGHDLLFHPCHAAEVAQKGLMAGKALARLVALPPDEDSVLRGELRRKKVAALSRPFDLSEFKSVGKRQSCTINDVLMAVLSGALGRYLRREQNPARDMEIRVVVPVDLRGGCVEQLGNRFGLVFLSLPVGEPDPRRRLEIVHRYMEELKGSAEAVVAFELLSAVGMMPQELEKKVVQWFGNKATAVVTNLPGPRQALHLAGSRIESLMYWVPQSGRLALGVSLMSYAGQLRLGVASDSALIPHPERLVEDFEHAYEEMRRLEAP